ncbi:MAG: hypothetical protein AB8C02_01895 [Halioglobus sp.]
MNTRKPFIALISLILLFSWSAIAEEEKPAVNYQIFLGTLKLDDQNINWQELSDGAAEVDFTNMPVAGIETEYAFHQGWIHWGINSGGSLAWKNNAATLSGSRTNGGVIQNSTLDSSMMLAEVHMGGYVRGRIKPRITTYAAAGPMLLYGRHETDDQQVFDAQGNSIEDTQVIASRDSSALNLGYYARAGIDFEVRKNQHLGVGLRYMASELDFDNTAGNIDIEGPQFVFTFSKKM